MSVKLDTIPYLQMEYADQIPISPDNKEEREDGDSKNNKKGLSFVTAAFFIVGEMAGSGVLVLPRAIADAGWAGVFLLIFCCCNALYAGICLGRCWQILEERWEEYRRKNRYPYPAIAFRAGGSKLRYFVSICLEINLLGVSIVFLLLTAQLISNLAAQWGVAFCYWVIIMAVVLWPLMWLGTPEDFWLAAVAAVLCTGLACILLIIAIAEHGQVLPFKPTYPSPSVESFFLSFGTIYFSFGGAASFPTFQNDMEDKTKFPMAAITGFAILFLMYFPVAVLGYDIYGSKVTDSIVDSLPNSGLKTTIIICLALHTFNAFLIVVNASSQEFEEMFKIPKNFGWKRIACRSALLAFIFFIACSVPKFDKVLNLVGGSAVTLTASVFPCLFYLLLCAQRSPEWPVRHIPIHEKVYLITIIACGIIGGIIATYSAFDGILKMSSFNPPCYVNITAAGRFS
ncbi:uncharacterized protein [Parasteatoda tepidariorum]|uniref:uncharacterized protein n=1 Tax=Parasteatoda tepidariorum TaxID=114398 RepID=UPI001C71B34D|nr:amino acid transporter AVT1J [Parasteatoda tepidariorum]